MRSFKHWWHLNNEKAAFNIPYKHIALCISYIIGRKVEDWADAQQEAMDERVSLSYNWLNEALWNKFEKAFNNTYMDLAEGVRANKDLQELHMKDGDIDMYIATFKKLLKFASYKEDEQGALKMFKTGLPARLNVRIINNHQTIPATLEEWIDTAH